MLWNAREQTWIEGHPPRRRDGFGVRLVREVAGLGDTDRLPSALESRGLPEELESGESGAAKRARLLASLFEHPA